MNYSNVNCSHLQQLSWIGRQEEIMLNSNEVHVWRGNISIYHSISAALLDDTENEKAKKYYREADRQKFIARRASLRLLLGKYLGKDPGDIRFTPGENKKPVLRDNDRDIHFNVAHAGDYFLIAIAGSLVGVDIEYLNAGFNYADITATQFSEEERYYIQKNEMPLRRFYELWTRKEALVKATAKGITDDFRFIPSLPGTNTVSSEIIGSAGNWATASFDIADDYTGSVTHRENNAVIFFDLAH